MSILVLDMAVYCHRKIPQAPCSPEATVMDQSLASVSPVFSTVPGFADSEE